MFDVAPTELMLVAIVALVVIGPKDLPRVLRMVGQWVGFGDDPDAVIAKARARLGGINGIGGEDAEPFASRQVVLGGVLLANLPPITPGMA